MDKDKLIKAYTDLCDEDIELLQRLDLFERKLTEEYDKSTGVERATLKMVFEMFSTCGL